MNTAKDPFNPSPLRVIKTDRPRYIVVANAKGGCGKTTLTTNLASYYANSGRPTALIDYDVQGSSAYWLQQRPENKPTITGVSAHSQDSRKLRNWMMRLPRDISRVIVDTPAGLGGTDLYDRVREADLLVLPILPSPIDIHAAARFIHDIHMTGCFRNEGKKLLVIANRIHSNTLMFDKLNRFLIQLDLPRVACIRDTQMYPQTMEHGLGISDLTSQKANRERRRWNQIGDWIERQFVETDSDASLPSQDSESIHPEQRL